MKRAEKQQRMEAQDNEEEQPSPIERNEQVVHANERVLLLLWIRNYITKMIHNNVNVKLYCIV